MKTNNRKVRTFFAFQHARCRCCYRSYLDRFLNKLYKNLVKVCDTANHFLQTICNILMYIKGLVYRFSDVLRMSLWYWSLRLLYASNTTPSSGEGWLDRVSSTVFIALGLGGGSVSFGDRNASPGDLDFKEIDIPRWSNDWKLFSDFAAMIHFYRYWLWEVFR